MKLIIKKARIKNFLSVGANPVEIEYTPGNHAVLGSIVGQETNNGCGKSTIFTDAIIFAFKGISIRGVNKDQMINAINKAECEVFLWFSIDSVNYKIERGLNPNFLRFINEDENNNSSETEYDERASLKEAQSQIDSTLVISTTSLINLITLNINYSKPFLRLDASDRRQVFLDVMNTSIFGKMLDKARKEYNSAKQDLKILIAELKAAEENYQTKLDTFNKMEIYKSDFELNKKNELDILKNEIDVSSIKLNELNSKKIKLNIKDILIKLNSSKEVYQKNAIESESTLSSNIKIITTYKNKIERIKKNPICSECNSPTTEGHALLHIEELNTTINKLNIENENYTSIIKTSKEKLKDIREKIDKAENVSEIQNKLSNQISLLEEKIKRDTNKTKDIQNKNFEIKNVVTETDLTNATLRITAKKNEIDEKDKQMLFADIARDRLGDKGVKSFSIKKIVPILNKKMNEYLSMFKANYTISFDNELNETLKSRRRDEFSYNNFSAGEQKRIDLALMFSLLSIARSRNSIDCNILILDEILDTSLCSDGTASLMTFMKTNLREMFPDLCVYIISHKTDISEDNFNTIIRLKKENNFTKIDYIQKCETVLQV